MCTPTEAEMGFPKILFTPLALQSLIRPSFVFVFLFVFFLIKDALCSEMKGVSRTVRATHAQLERTNSVAPPSCPPAAGRRRGESRPERGVKSHGTLGMR